MFIKMPYNKRYIEIKVPDETMVYRTFYKGSESDPRTLVRNALKNPIGSLSLSENLKRAKARSVVLVASDITRPIPYFDFIKTMLEEIENAAVPRDKITILIATGMHRPSTTAEREHMFGRHVCENYRIIDHRAEKNDDLVKYSGTSHAGRPIELNRHFVEADFRIVTGLVEPHFMAGFSGGRKAICPGLCSLETVKAFHSFAFLDNPAARNGNLKSNPLHDEALSIARQARVDFCLNLIVDSAHKLVNAVAGDLEASHEMACKFVSKYACPAVDQEADVVLTSSGGYPLDATFYQCVKGMCSCLPAVKKKGIVISIGSCSEGIGSEEYRQIMFKYSDRWQEFLKYMQSTDKIIKDQWEFQMQTKTLKHVGGDNLIFVTDGLSASDLNKLNVAGIHSPKDGLQEKIQKIVDEFLLEGRSLAVIPEGPYCAPISQKPATSVLE